MMPQPLVRQNALTQDKFTSILATLYKPKPFVRQNALTTEQFSTILKNLSSDSG